jgi:polyisoprenoid-binding protein YceI
MKSTLVTAAFITLISTVGFSQTWNWDKAHSQLNFGITHLGISETRRQLRQRHREDHRFQG